MLLSGASSSHHQFAITMLRTLVRRAAEAPKPFNFATNPYKAKKTWPPDFSNISRKHQFRFERRYKRRAKLKWARPRWTKGIKLAQNGIIICMQVASLPGRSIADHGRSCASIRSPVYGLGEGRYTFQRSTYCLRTTYCMYANIRRYGTGIRALQARYGRIARNWNQQ
jgi:hypothetical protein